MRARETPAVIPTAIRTASVHLAAKNLINDSSRPRGWERGKLQQWSPQRSELGPPNGKKSNLCLIWDGVAESDRDTSDQNSHQAQGNWINFLDTEDDRASDDNFQWNVNKCNIFRYKFFRKVLWIRVGARRIRIQIFILMQIRIQWAKPMRIGPSDSKVTRSWIFTWKIYFKKVP